MLFEQIERRLKRLQKVHGVQPKEEPMPEETSVPYPMLRVPEPEPETKEEEHRTCGVSLPLSVHEQLKRRAKANKTTIKEEALRAIRRGLQNPQG